MRRFKDENLKKQTNKLEKQLSKRLGGLKQPVSGALNNKKLKGTLQCIYGNLTVLTYTDIEVQLPKAPVCPTGNFESVLHTF